MVIRYRERSRGGSGASRGVPEGAVPPPRGEKEILGAIRTGFAALGMRVPQRPTADDGSPLDPQLPGDLTNLDDTEIGQLHSQFAAMAVYAQVCLASKSVTAALRKRAERVTRAEVRLREREGTNPEKEARVEESRQVQEVGYHLLVAEGVRELTEGMLQAYLIGRDACSRELSRRANVYR